MPENEVDSSGEPDNDESPETAAPDKTPEVVEAATVEATTAEPEQSPAPPPFEGEPVRTSTEPSDRSSTEAQIEVTPAAAGEPVPEP
ncbi:MAG: hypothetical protein ACR2NL_05170, partial [Acidimicrobiia bacterium]